MTKGDREFTVTEDHVKLLRRAYVHWEDCDFGAPAIDCKRPYGNKSVLNDMVEILGIPRTMNEDEEYDDLTDLQVDELCRIHKETLTALQIFLDTGKMEPGRYVLPENQWAKGWQKEGEKK